MPTSDGHGATTTPGETDPETEADADPEVTLEGLLAGLVELERLSHAPRPAFVSLLASSTDPSSRGAAPGTSAFFANADFAVWQGREPLLLLDTEGPGVVTHLWSANPTGTLRVYVDGAAQPVLSAPMRSLLGGDEPPFTSPYAFVVAGGYNFYFPIAFQKHCTITVQSDQDGEHRLYYQVDHLRYASSARVQSFSKARLARAEPVRLRVEQQLTDPWASAASAASAASGQTHELRVELAPGQAWQTTLQAAADGGVLRELRLHADPLDPRALRETKLEVFVDGERTVHAPLGELFAASPEPRAVQALPVSLDPAKQLLTSRWPMPFAKTLRVLLTSTGTLGLSGTLRLTSEARDYAADTRLFYAQWHAPGWQKSEPTHDFTLGGLKGEGLYVGNVLHVLNTDTSWWGEGDEKVYVDGEAFPSRFGTGTEDYYGYAYCSNERFDTAYLGQPSAGTRKNFGAVTLYRFHTLDAIAFRSSLRFDLEVNHWGQTPLDVAYDGTVFFYARPGARFTTPVAPDAAYLLPENPAPAPVELPEQPYTCGGS